MERIMKYCDKYNIDEEGKEEMLKVLNESIVEISRGILENNKVKVVKEKVGVKVKGEGKRYKSKKAEEYAELNGIEIEEFEMEEISKKDVENKVAERAKEKKEENSSNKISEGSTSKEVKKVREKVICSGINKKGEACKSVGTIQPEGAKKKYCFRHAEDYKSFECDSDSSDEEEVEKCEEVLEEEEYDKQKVI